MSVVRRMVAPVLEDAPLAEAIFALVGAARSPASPAGFGDVRDRRLMASPHVALFGPPASPGSAHGGSPFTRRSGFGAALEVGAPRVAGIGRLGIRRVGLECAAPPAHKPSR